MPAGRPTLYDQTIADTICERIAEGESLRAICLSESMPSKATVFRWLGKHDEFRDQYARCREHQAEALADEIVGISDGEKGADAARDRLRVDARKWVASKLLPKKYGDKVTNEHTGEGGGPVQIQRFEVDFVGPEKG